MLEQLRLLTDFEFQTHRITFDCGVNLNGYPFFINGLRIVATRKPPRKEVFIVDADDTGAGYAEMWRQLTENNGFSAQNPA